ncbi:MAG: HAMP domain-containing histidine kinase [Clostridia bacterium]|nr:HAMP domain-containing histidine kinase [Clostridia bacterium]
MSIRIKPRRSITFRLIQLFIVLLVLFTLIVGILYNGQMRRQTIAHYSQTMQRDAHAIAQNLSEWIAPSHYESLDETRFIVSDDTLTPYLGFIEQLTNSTVYIMDTRHNVTGYFSGVVQTIENPLLPSYLEQSIALGFMGKTPFIQAQVGGETHLTTCMPVMNVHSQVLGVVLLTSTLREQGYAQVPSGTILMQSLLISFPLAVLLAFFFSSMFTRPIAKLQQVALSLAGGRYETRTNMNKPDEIGSLAHSMDILAERLEQARAHDEELRIQQQNFFSNISHELKTPVTVIRGSLEALSDGVIRGEANIRAYYDQMISESRWLQRLIQDLLELSRLQSLEFSLNTATVDLTELLGDVAMSANALCERKGVRFACEEPSTAFTLEGDYSRLRQMLLAVIDNSVKFTPSGRAIRMSLSSEAPVITISDEGVGIARDEIDHIFDRFRHTHDASRESTGLGLAIVQEIARRHDVSIQVASQEGKGTTFTFSFPHHA